jgi:hypothetical protein
MHLVSHTNQKVESSYIEKSFRFALNPILIDFSPLGVSLNKGKNKVEGESSTLNDHDLSNNFNAKVKNEETIHVFSQER